MGIFVRRPLCLFCCLFLLGSVGAWFCPSALLPYLIGASIFIIGLLAVVVLLSHKHRIFLLTVMLCVVSLGSSLLHSFLSVDLPQMRAWEYLGEREVEVLVTEVISESPYASRYRGKLLLADEKKTNCRVLIEHSFDVSVSVGDRIYALAQIDRTVAADTPTLTRNRDGELLRLTLLSDEASYIRRNSELTGAKLWQSEDRFLILGSRVQTWIDVRLSDLLGEEVGSLSDAFLLGDTSDLSRTLIRDFRRAGVSHMMAVSGLHISILLGSVELLLRRIFLPKRIRCLLVTLLAIFFLFLTGFSLSACRSVLMLWAVYLSFFAGEENDTLTALFLSIVLILLVIPYSVADLGMWMSFLATLGLVTVYPLCESKLPRAQKLPMRWLRQCVCLICMTLVANLFLLPILWIFFGELSAIAVPANLILMPFSYLLLIGTVTVLILGSVPLLGNLLCLLLQWSGRLLIALVSWCSSFSGATLSLRYGFCSVLIPIFALSLLLLLVIRLRRRWILALPPVLTALSFAVCFAVVWHQNPNPTLSYINDGKQNEYFCVEEHTSLAICDISRGGFDARQTVYEAYLDSNATEIETLVLTHYHTGHRTALASLCERLLVRTVYLPMPQDNDSLLLATELEEIAQERGSEIVFYESGSVLRLTPHSSLRVDCEGSMALSFAGRRDTVTYLSAQSTPSEELLRISRYLLFGSHGKLPDAAGSLSFLQDSKVEAFIYTSSRLPIHTELDPERDVVYMPKQEGGRYSFSFLLP